MSVCGVVYFNSCVVKVLLETVGTLAYITCTTVVRLLYGDSVDVSLVMYK